MTVVIYRSLMPVTREELFAFHQRLSNLERISPPFPRLRIENASEPSGEGDLQQIVLSAGPCRLRWDARVVRVVPESLIEDIQERGPFRRWRHQHRFTEAGPGASRLTDAITFSLLPTPAGAFVDWLVVRPAIRLMLGLRHRRTRKVLEAKGGESRGAG